MAQKIPPPPFLTGPEYSGFNRWLLELTGILNDGGGIDPNSVAGLTAVILQSAANAVAITALQILTAAQGGSIATLQSQVATLQGNITTINGQLTTLGARAVVFQGAGAPAAGLGNINDWYANVGGAVGARIYIKTGVATWTAFPF